MDTKQSLTSFFEKRGLDTDACGQEQIHRIDAMQSGSELIVCENKSDTWVVVSATQDIVDCYDKQGTPLLGMRLSEVNEDLDKNILELQNEVQKKGGLRFLSDSIDMMDRTYDAIIHYGENAGVHHLFIELAPTEAVNSAQLKRGIRTVQRAIFDLGRADSIEQAAQQSVTLLKDLLDYDRVMIYRFQEDWTGEVIAESCAPDATSFLGLRFPSGDIPPQARELFRILPYRMLINTDDTRNSIVHADPGGQSRPSYDLSQVICRAVSVYHTKYLRNMGVNASMSIGLEKNGKLWGIFAFHHNTKRCCSYEMVTLAQEIARSFMSCESRLQELDKIKKVQQMRRIEARVAQNIRGSGSVAEALTTLAPTLLELIPSTGTAIIYGDSVATSGAVPPDEFLRQLVAWSQKTEDTTSFATTNLQAKWDGADRYKDVACGVMIQPVLLNRVCQIIWFRKPLSAQINWAGASETDVTKLKKERDTPLTPRVSFEAWRMQNSNFSADWTDAEISATKEIFTDVLDIVASQARLLTSMNERLSLAESDLRRELEQFASAASHDMRGPIRVIKIAASMVKEDAIEIDEDTKEHLSDIASASDRLAKLTDGMLAYTRLSQLQASLESVDVSEILRGLVPIYRRDAAGNTVEIELGDIPNVMGDPHLVEIMLDNLIGNAVKYHPGGRPVCIKVDSEMLGEECRIRITDNGDGIESQYAEKIFEPFTRLHRKDEIDGSGLGLAMCKRVASLLNADIILDPDYKQGCRFAIQIRRDIVVKGIPSTVLTEPKIPPENRIN